MLAVDITWQPGSRRLPLLASIAISNIRGGCIADYAILGADVTRKELCRCQLLSYPRWSEPISALVARSIDLVKANLPHEVDPGDVAGARVRISIVPVGIVHRTRTLAELTLVVAKRRASVTLAEEPLPVVDRDFQLSSANPDPLQLLVESFSQVAWRCSELPATPLRAPEPPRFAHGVRSYIRSRDIPPWVVQEFKRRAARHEIQIRHETQQCYDARAWDAFLGPQSQDQ